MKTFALKFLQFVVQALIDAKVFEVIKDLVVLVATRDDMTGAEKKEAVKEALDHLKGDVAEKLKNTAGSFINFAIEAAVVLLKGGKIG